MRISLSILFTLLLGSTTAIQTRNDACDISEGMMGKVKQVKQLGAGPMHTLNPFLFCVYHKDLFPAGTEKMQVPNKIGNGMDFNPEQEYRMYHGRKVPGFPQHPHRGFETLTATLEGITDHTDSLGNAGRYGNGDLQWMTAGKGIVHGENFPLINETKPNPLKLFQIWLNLPKRNKLVDPDFVMHWEEDIPKVKTSDFEVTVFAGSFGGRNGLKPTKHSWAQDPHNEVSVLFMKIQPNGSVSIPGATGGTSINRAMYIVEGMQSNINGKSIKRSSDLFGTFVEVTAGDETVVTNDSNEQVEVLMLQGRPIENETVVQHGPFVMNSQQDIIDTIHEYKRTQFGGWPWNSDTVLFEKKKPRFARVNGVEFYPPSVKAGEA